MNIKQIPAALAAQMNAVHDALTPEAQAFVSREAIAEVLTAAQRAGVPFDPIATVIKFNVDAGNSADKLNVRMSALYAGLQVEELAEKLEAIGLVAIAKVFDDVATTLKRGDHDVTVAAALADPDKRVAMLDADCDLMVVSVGASIAQGADFPGAIREVCMSNDSKRNSAGGFDVDANGKIKKGAGYFVANLKPFVLKAPSRNTLANLLQPTPVPAGAHLAPMIPHAGQVRQ